MKKAKWGNTKSKVVVIIKNTPMLDNIGSAAARSFFAIFLYIVLDSWEKCRNSVVIYDNKSVLALIDYPLLH